LGFEDFGHESKNKIDSSKKLTIVWYLYGIVKQNNLYNQLPYLLHVELIKVVLYSHSKLELFLSNL